MTHKFRTRSPLNPGNVPLLSNWRTPEQPFRGHSPGLGIQNPALTLAGFRDTSLPELEAQVGAWNTLPSALLDLLARHRLATARIVVDWGVNYQGKEGTWTGTGFLVAPNILLTNNHVLDGIANARSAMAQFAYERPGNTLGLGTQPQNPPFVEVALDPSRLFVTSPVRGGLDYTFVWIDAEATKGFGTIEMQRGSFTARLGEPVFVIHHPRGRPQEVSVDDTETLGINEDCLLYAADTDYGSSGAPVINRNGRLVALHHANRSAAQISAIYPNAQDMLTDGGRVRIANEGIKVSAIAIDLEAKSAKGDQEGVQAGEVLRHMAGSDTITGVYGALGRRSQLSQDHARALSLYRASDQDIDLGFWNLEWMAREHGKEDAAALGMVDINLDLWCLTDAPDGAVERIARNISQRFGDDFEVLALGGTVERPSLRMAAIFRKTSINVVRLNWPARIDAAFRHSAAQFGAPVFPHPPARLAISRSGQGDVTTYLVCFDQHPQVRLATGVTGTDGPGTKAQTRLTSKMLVRAIEATNPADGGAVDWIIGGRVFDPPLAHGDSKPLERQGFQAVGLLNTARGNGISYLRAPESHVQKIWTTHEIKAQWDDGHFVEQRTDRTVDKFFAALAGSRPATLRLTLNDISRARADDRLDRAVDQIFSGTEQGIPQCPSPFVAAEQPFGGGVTTGTGCTLDTTPTDLAQFIERNGSVLDAICRRAVIALDPVDGLAVTGDELRVVFALDGALKDGRIDPNGHHKSGAQGFLPLPSTISDWIGPDAPGWNRPMTLTQNIASFVHYLTAIKNRSITTIGGMNCYAGLFRHPGIVGHRAKTRRLLLGVLDGLFLPSNYRNARLPLQELLDTYAAERDIFAALTANGFSATSQARHNRRSILAKEVMQTVLQSASDGKGTRGGK